MSEDRYQNPLTARYASDEMAQLWSSQRKFSTWRRMWIALAESQQALGLDISDAQLDELRSQADQIDFAIGIVSVDPVGELSESLT